MSLYTLAFVALLAGEGICADLQRPSGAHEETPHYLRAWTDSRQGGTLLPHQAFLHHQLPVLHLMTQALSRA
jgi:hypothetical protein